MFFDTIPMEVRRRVKPDPMTPKWGTTTTNTWTTLGTVYGSPQAFTADEGQQSDQRFANLRDLVVFDNPDIDVLEGDEIYYYGEWKRVQFIQRFKQSLLPHAEAYMAGTQYQRD